MTKVIILGHDFHAFIMIHNNSPHRKNDKTRQYRQLLPESFFFNASESCQIQQKKEKSEKNKKKP